MNSFRACREMINNLATPAEKEALAGLNNNQLLRQAYVNVGSGVALLGELFARYAQLNRDFRELEAVHQGCGSLADQLHDTEEERNSVRGQFDQLLKEFRELEDEVAAASTRTEGLTDQLEEMEKDRNDWMKVSSTQATRIKELEQQLKDKTLEVDRLTAENKQRVTELASSEVVRHNTVKELLPAAFRRLFESAEYKKSLGRVYSLSYSGGFIDGVKAERKPEEAQQILGKVKKLNMDAPSLWKQEYHKLFKAEYPFVKKISEAHRLPLGDLMNFYPDPPAAQVNQPKEGNLKPQDKPSTLPGSGVDKDVA